MPTYWEHRHGTAGGPIELVAADGFGTVTLTHDINMFDTSWFTVRDVTIRPGGDVFHCEQCRHITISHVHFDGGARVAHETIKVNQSSDIVIENSDIHGANDNAIDFVAVVNARIVNNKIHDSEDWCAYAKGGSVNIVVEGNEIYNCGTGGFTAGQGSGLEFMMAPHLTYDAEDVMVRNNEIHDTDGAGLGVNGGLRITMTGNHLVRVGRRSHLVEFTFGARGCDGDIAKCRALLAQGAWGTDQRDDGTNAVAIPNQDVRFENNVIDNPAPYRSGWQHFEIPGPRQGKRADDGLVIANNTIHNGGPDMPLGIGDGTGCAPTNPTCNETQLRRDNRIN